MPKAAVLSSAVETAAKCPPAAAPSAAAQPGLRGAGVGHRLDGGEGLGGDDHQRRARVEPRRACRGHARRRRSRRSAAAGRRRRARAPASPSPGRGREPPMPMLTTSVKPPAGAGDRAVAHAVREGGHAVEHGVHLGHHVVAVDQHRRVRAVAQRGVQHGAAFGDVDRLAAEHRVAPGGHAARLGELDQQRQRVGVEVGLGEVEQHVAERTENSRNRSGLRSKSVAMRRSCASAPAAASAVQIVLGHLLTARSWLAVRASASISSHLPALHQRGARDPGAADAEHVRQRKVVRRVLRRDAAGRAEAAPAAAGRRRPSAPAAPPFASAGKNFATS